MQPYLNGFLFNKIDGMEKELRVQMKEMGTNDYATARGFVKRLKREVRYAAS